jgi:hypothetical protein
VTSLIDILTRTASGDIAPDIFAGTFTKPDAETPYEQLAPAFKAATTPYLSGVGPRFQGNIQKIMADRMRRAMVSAPEQFLTPEDVFNQFTPYIPGWERFKEPVTSFHQIAGLEDYLKKVD